MGSGGVKDESRWSNGHKERRTRGRVLVLRGKRRRGRTRPRASHLAEVVQVETIGSHLLGSASRETRSLVLPQKRISGGASMRQCWSLLKDSVCVCVCVNTVAHRDQKSWTKPCGVRHGCWESNLGLLEEQNDAEPSQQPHIDNFLLCILTTSHSSPNPSQIYYQAPPNFVPLPFNNPQSTICARDIFRVWSDPLASS